MVSSNKCSCIAIQEATSQVFKQTNDSLNEMDDVLKSLAKQVKHFKIENERKSAAASTIFQPVEKPVEPVVQPIVKPIVAKPTPLVEIVIVIDGSDSFNKKG